jgi:hypothetical protein
MIGHASLQRFLGGKRMRTGMTLQSLSSSGVTSVPDLGSQSIVAITRSIEDAKSKPPLVLRL